MIRGIIVFGGRLVTKSEQGSRMDMDQFDWVTRHLTIGGLTCG
jgi:hypothetical protein